MNWPYLSLMEIPMIMTAYISIYILAGHTQCSHGTMPISIAHNVRELNMQISSDVRNENIFQKSAQIE